MKTNNKGFSLVELIVVIAIMAILAAVAIPTFASFISKANIAADVDMMNNVEYAVELAYAAENKEITKIEVVLTADQGAVSSVKVYVDNVTTPDIVVAKTGNTDDDAETQEKMNLIADTIDWDYDFKAKVDDLEADTKWKDDATKDVVWDLTTGS